MKKTIDEKMFVGRPFPASLMNAQKSFMDANQQMENDETFQKFLADNNLENKRTALIVSGPDSFMYWYGVLADTDKVPTGLMKFELPKAEVAEEEQENQNLVFFNLPLTSTVSSFVKKVVDSGIKVYQNLGDSDTPYMVWDLDMDTKKLTQDLYLKASK
ncbi:hypothetical protein [uncultured Lactobacillus sp.]|uniref:hypothetical protein n=1 Tax=uncultured Lactobacillus sp. TaxID=153152 RepID=UPI0028048AE2|nr:hypothetical protein [uncultured Lactobacillus sp.]